MGSLALVFTVPLSGCGSDLSEEASVGDLVFENRDDDRHEITVRVTEGPKNFEIIRELSSPSGRIFRDYTRHIEREVFETPGTYQLEAYTGTGSSDVFRYSLQESEENELEGGFPIVTVREGGSVDIQGFIDG